MLKTEYARAGRRQWSLENPGIPHPLDVPARLAEFRELENGWADGMQIAGDQGSNYGKAPAPDGLHWLSGAFERHYPDDIPLPYAYPTPEGGVQLEWSLGTIEIDLEIDLQEHKAEWHCLDFGANVSDLRNLDLDNPKDWSWLAQEIRRLESKA